MNTTNKTKQITKYQVYFATNTEQQTKEIKKLVCSIFGGYSLHSISGGWLDDDTNKILEEKSFYLEILSNKDERHILNLCEHITRIAEQTEVFYLSEAVKLNIIKNNNNKQK